jgi:glycopeptide antibiotics resistance protein
MKRNRYLYCVIACVVVVLGLASRRHSAMLPSFLAQYAGDTLWAVMVFIGIGLMATKSSSIRVAIAALVVSCAVELSQLYHASWIDSVRDTLIGGLVLGYGFLWSDIACYTAGVALGVAVEMSLRKAAR